MASNFVQPGDVLELTAPVGGVVAGKGYLIGSIFVVAQDTKSAGETFRGARKGVFDLAKTNAVAFTEGAKVSFDTATLATLAPAGGKVPVGSAVKAAAGGDATVRVALDGIATAAA